MNEGQDMAGKKRDSEYWTVIYPNMTGNLTIIQKGREPITCTALELHRAMKQKRQETP